LTQHQGKQISRRDFLRLAGIGAVATRAASAGPFFLFSERAKSNRGKLRILQWKHPVPGYDEWFENALAKEWGEKNDTEVIVDHVPVEEIGRRADAETAAGAGHDLVWFPYPPAPYERHAIDHNEIYQEVQARHQQMILLAHKSTFSPRTKKYFAFSDCYMPCASNWLFDAWKRIGLPGGPTDYDTLRRGAREIRKKFGIPCGFGLGSNLTSNVALQALLWSFGGFLQDERGNVALNSRETAEALRYSKALYRGSETPEVFAWQWDSNVKQMLEKKISFTMSAIFLTRQGEQEKSEAVRDILVSPALKGQFFWLACPHVTSCYVIWDFAENKEGARRFLVHLIDNYSGVLKASRLSNFPCFPSLAANLRTQLLNDPDATPPYKYMGLEDALHWTQNLGHPGYATAPVVEIFQKSVVPRMFAEVVRGALSPAEAAAAAEREAKRIFAKWERA
jgi:multiple sugar transport system substrate-binding protein